MEAAPAPSAERPLTQTGFYWYRPDIIPSGAHHLHRFVSDGSRAEAKEVQEFPTPEENAPAILQSQFLNYRVRSAGILAASRSPASSGSEQQAQGQQQMKRVFAVGGAASNPVICQVLADVLGCDVCKPVVDDEDQPEADEDDEDEEDGEDELLTSDSEGSISSSRASRSRRPRKVKNADFNSCSVAAAYKAKWCYVRRFNADHRASLGAGAEEREEISFEEMVKESRQIRHLRRAIARSTRIQERRLARRAKGAADDEPKAKGAIAAAAQAPISVEGNGAAHQSSPAVGLGIANVIQAPAPANTANSPSTSAITDEEDDETDDEGDNGKAPKGRRGTIKAAQNLFNKLSMAAPAPAASNDTKADAALAVAPKANGNAAPKQQQPVNDEDEEEDGVAVVASPRRDRTLGYAASALWWSQLEMRAVQQAANVTA